MPVNPSPLIRPRQARRRPSPPVWLMLSPVVAIAAVGAVAIAINRMPRTLLLRATVLPSVLTLGIVNDGADDWHDARITINRGYHSEPLEVFPSGKGYTLNLMMCVDDDGRRFAPAEQAVISVTIKATVQGEAAEYHWAR